jgi:hypothetical protein
MRIMALLLWFVQEWGALLPLVLEHLKMYFKALILVFQPSIVILWLLLQLNYRSQMIVTRKLWPPELDTYKDYKFNRPFQSKCLANHMAFLLRTGWLSVLSSSFQLSVLLSNLNSSNYIKITKVQMLQPQIQLNYPRTYS